MKPYFQCLQTDTQSVIMSPEMILLKQSISKLNSTELQMDRFCLTHLVSSSLIDRSSVSGAGSS